MASLVASLEARVRDSRLIWRAQQQLDPSLPHKRYKMLEHDQWPEVMKLARIFNSFVYGKLMQKVPSFYRIDRQQGICYFPRTTETQTEHRLFENSFLDRFTHVICILSPMEFVLVDSKHMAYKFHVDPQTLLWSVTNLPNILDRILQSIFQAFGPKLYTSGLLQGLDVWKMRIRSMELQNHSINIRIRIGDYGSYFLVYDSSQETSSCCLGQLSLLAHQIGGSIRIHISEKNFSIPVSDKTDMELVQVSNNFLVVTAHLEDREHNVSQYRFNIYDLISGCLIFCYIPHSQNEDYKPQKVFFFKRFALFYYQRSDRQLRANLIDLERKIAIPLTELTQDLFCSFDTITGLDFIETNQGTVHAVLKGERDDETYVIESEINPYQNNPLIYLDQGLEVVSNQKSPENRPVRESCGCGYA